MEFRSFYCRQVDIYCWKNQLLLRHSVNARTFECSNVKVRLTLPTHAWCFCSPVFCFLDLCASSSSCATWCPTQVATWHDATRKLQVGRTRAAHSGDHLPRRAFAHVRSERPHVQMPECSKRVSEVRINPFTFLSIHLSIHLRSNQFIYVRVNPITFASIHLRSKHSIYVRINAFTFASIHLGSHRFNEAWPRAGQG